MSLCFYTENINFTLSRISKLYFAIPLDMKIYKNIKNRKMQMCSNLGAFKLILPSKNYFYSEIFTYFCQEELRIHLNIEFFKYLKKSKKSKISSNSAAFVFRIFFNVIFLNYSISLYLPLETKTKKIDTKLYELEPF